MGKKKADEKPRLTNSTATMDIDSILSQLSSLEDNSKSFITGKPEDQETDAIWKADMEALEQAAAILKALQDEGIGDPEQVRDLIADYNAIASERQEMYRKYETPDPAITVGGTAFCPDCKTQIYYRPRHCPGCGKRLLQERGWNQAQERNSARRERKPK